MEFFNPWSFDHIVVSGMALKLLNFGLVNVRFDVIAEIREEKNLSLTIPKEGMIEQILEHQLSRIFTDSSIFNVFVRYLSLASRFIKNEIKELEIFILTVSLVSQ